MSSPTDTKHNMVARQSFSSSPRLVTPSGSPPTMTAQGFPPTFSEARLAQLLSRFDDGTHIFDREERETLEDRRMSFNDGEQPSLSWRLFLTAVLPPHPAQRRPSFLSGLSLTRPGFGFSSGPSSGASTPISAAPKDNVTSSLAMTSTATAEPELISRPKSTPLVAQQQQSKQHRPDPHFMRSNTVPQKGGFTFHGTQTQVHYPAPHEEHRHFDPSKEPRLLGLL